MSLSYWNKFDKRKDNKTKKDSIDKGFDHFLRTKQMFEDDESIETANTLLLALHKKGKDGLENN